MKRRNPSPFNRFLFVLLSIVVLASGKVQSQVTTNGGSGLAANYPSLAAAITALNAASITSPVLITLTGNETAPMGGYSITAQGSVANTITIQGITSTITAFTPQASGSNNDALFKIIGGDYITIQNFTMQENPANTFNDPATNNMTEWGVALLVSSYTNGSQNNTIQNNTISLNRNYVNSVGIYSNVRHSATTPGTAFNINDISGSNRNNHIYNNQISNVNMGIVFVGANNAAYMDTGNDIGGAAAATGNTMTNWGNILPTSGAFYGVSTTTLFGIYVQNQTGLNLSYNTLNSAAVGNNAVSFRGIFLDFSAASALTFINNITNNSVSISSAMLAPSTGSTPVMFEAIFSQGTISASTLNINNNTILNCALTGANSATILKGIYNKAVVNALNMSNNIIRDNTSTATTGGFEGIRNDGNVISSIAVDNNQIGNNAGNAITFLAATTSGSVYAIRNRGAAATCTLSNTANNIQGIVHAVTGSSVHYYIEITNTCLANTITIKNNTYTNLNANTTGDVNFIYSTILSAANATLAVTGNSIVTAFNKPASGGSVSIFNSYYGTPPVGDPTSIITFNNNNFSNITVTGTTNLYGLKDYSTLSNNRTFSNNTFSNWTCGTGWVYAISVNYGTSIISNNTISGFTVPAGSTRFMYGIYTTGTATCTIRANTISGLTTGGTSSSYGIFSNCPNVTITGNKIYNISNTQLAGGGQTSGDVCGINVNNSAPGTVNVINNYVGDLRFPHCNLLDYAAVHQVNGITLWGNASSVVFNVYYNTVYLNTTSTGGTFGSSAIYAPSSATLCMRNNIFVNKSTPKGNGNTVAFRGSFVTTLASYASTSDNNLFYAGVPDPNHQVFFGGNSDTEIWQFFSFQAYVAPRDKSSITEDPPFISTVGTDPLYLHIDNSCKVPASSIESGGAYIVGIDNDYDGDLRWGASGYAGQGSAPDIGADEFNSLSILVTATAGVLGPTSYNTLRKAFANINNGTHKGNITMQLYCNLTEVDTAVLNASGTNGASYSSVLIYPMLSGLSISSNLSNALIDLNGADNVTIDGRVNLTGAADLSIIHTGTDNASRNILFRNSATYNKIRYCKIKGGCPDPNAGMIYFSPSTSAPGNDNNTFEFCEFTNSGTRPLNVIFSDGANGRDNSNNSILNNNFYNFLNPAIASNGIYLRDYTTAWNISGNSFYENTSFAPASAVEYSAIRISNTYGNNFIISGNYIGGSTPLCGGTAWTKTNSSTNVFSGIYFDVSTATASNMQGNTIRNFAWSNSAAANWSGILINNGVVNIGTTTGNIVGAASGTGSVSVTNSGATADVTGIRHLGNAAGVIQNNTIGSISTDNDGVFSTHIYGIFKSGGTGVLTISNNNIGSQITANSFNAASASTGNGQSVLGIYNATAANITISGNTISNLANACTSAGNTMGIYLLGAGTSTVSKNFIFNLSTTNNASTVYGIRITSGAGTYSNNIITLGNGVAAGSTMYGISENSTLTNAVYFNTVYIGSAGSGITFALFSAGTNTRNFRNNILYNARTGGTNYAISLAGNTGLTIDYNDYYAPGNILGRYNGNNQAGIAAWRLVTTQDVHSFNLNPVFAGAGGTVENGYKPGVALSGISIGGITTDYNNITRANPPTMGALESETISTTSLTPSTVCTGSILNVCFSSTGTFVSGNTYTAQLSDATGSFASAVNLSPVLTSNVSGAQCINNVIIPVGTVAGANYRIRVISSSPVGTGDAGLPLTIKQSPTLSFALTHVTCAQPSTGAINLTVSGGSGTYTGYSWTAGNGFDLTGQQYNQNLTGLTAGTYTVTVTDANSCSSTSSATIITTTLPPTPTLSATSPCVGNNPQFTAGNGTNYQFFFNGISQGAPSAVNTFTPATVLADGDMVCVRSLSAADCYSETCITIHSVPAPTANNVTVCYDGNSHAASASAAGSTIVYYNAAMGGSTISAPSATAVGTYTAWAEAVDIGTSCISATRTQVTLQIKTRPDIDQASNLKYCNGEAAPAVNFNGLPAGGVFSWVSSKDIGFGTSGTAIDAYTATNLTNDSIIQPVNVRYSYDGCTSLPMVFYDTVYPTPIVNPLPNLTYCNGDAAPAVYFSSPTSGTIHYNWNTDLNIGASGVDSIIFAPVNTTPAPITATVSVTATAYGCSGPTTTFFITINPPPTPGIKADYCSVPGKIVLTDTADLPAVTSYLWNVSPPGNTSPSIQVDVAQNYSVKATNTYGCQATAYMNLGTELVTDGSFTNFRTDAIPFVTGYILNQWYYDGYQVSSGLMEQNKYAVNVSAWSNQPLYPTPALPLNNGYHPWMHGRDHTNNTTGPRNFMMVNGSDGFVNGGQERIIWQQTVPVMYQRDYYFSAWAMNLTSGNPARLQFQINGQPVGSILDLNTLPKPTTEAQVDISNWGRFYNTSLWTPPAGVTQAVIKIVNLNHAASGNDFGLDDISFGLMGSIPDASSANANGGGTVCVGDNVKFAANSLHGGLPPYTYQWTDPGNNVFSTDSTVYIYNAQASNSGNYTLVVTDQHGCQSVPAITSLIVNPFAVTPTAAAVDRSAVCSGDGGNINLSVIGGSGTTLQWFAADTTAGVPIGTGSPLTISSPLITTTYYARWISGCGTSYFKPVTVQVGSQWSGTNGTDWNVSSNWSSGCGVPDATKDAIISNSPPKPQPIVNITGAACKNLTMDAAASLTIDAGKSLTVNNNLNNAGNLTINSNSLSNNGSLIVKGSSSGNVIYNRYLESNRWFITSPPVNNAFSLAGSQVDIISGTYNFAPYVEANNDGWNYLPAIPASLTPGMGYLIKLLSGNTVQYSGSLNNDVTLSLPCSNTMYGWNAVGNPYPSAIRIKDEGATQGFISQNTNALDPNYQAIYLWNQSGTYTPGDQYYYVICNSGYSGKAYNGSLPETYVQPGQGFLVNIRYNGGSNRNIIFSKGNTGFGMQIHDNSYPLRKAEISWPGITLLASAGGKTRSTVVAFHEGMTTGLDPSYDAGLLSASDFNLYTHLVSGDNQTNFTIQCLPDHQYDSLVVPVGMDMPQAGNVTFKADGIILPDGVYPIIEDRLTHTSIPLITLNDSLIADISEPSYGTGRFYLRFKGENSTVNTGNPALAQNLRAIYSNQTITLFGTPEEGSHAWLYDVNGRRLGGEYLLTATNKNTIPAYGLSNGIYLLRIEGKTTRQTLKITVLNP